MEAAPRHLHSVDPVSGEVLPGGCPDCKALEMELRGKRSQITKLKNENARLMGVEPDHDDILQVCEFHRRMVVPNGSVAVGSKGWTTVRARLRDVHPGTERKLFDPLRLRAAVCGIALDAWHMEKGHSHRRYLENAFRDAGKVDRLIDLAIGFRRETGTSALELLDDLAGDRLAWLADRCSCGGLRVAHLMGRTECQVFDEFEADQWRWLRQQDESVTS